MARKAPRAIKRSKNLGGCYCDVTASSFVDCLSAKVFQFRGTSYGEFIGDGKHAGRFAAAILLVESVANNSPYRKRSACCVRFAKHRQMANCSCSALPNRSTCKEL